MAISDDIKRLRRLNHNLIPEKQEDCARLLALATGGAISYDKVGTSGSSDNKQLSKNSDYADANAELSQLKNEREYLIRRLTSEINEVFSEPEDDEKRRMAKLRYIDDASIKAIANKHMHFSYGYVKNKLAEIKVLLEDVT